MKVISYRHELLTNYQIGDLVVYYDYYTNKKRTGIIVRLNVEDYQEEVYNEFTLELEEVLIEYLTYTISTKSGLDDITEEQISQSFSLFYPTNN